MRSIFWRIFLSFWLAMTLIVVASVVVSLYLAAERRDAAEDFRPDDAFEAAARSLNTGGTGALRDWLKAHTEIAPGRALYIFDEHGSELLDRMPPPDVRRRLRRSRFAEHVDGHRLPPNFRPSRRFPRLVGPGGDEFLLLVGFVRPGPFGVLGDSRLPVVAIALALSALVCWLLARTFTRPVVQLQQAAKALAEGALDTRIAAPLQARSDEFGALARDFDAMARGLERILQSQRELLRNVSHELRSPLARISVALELARRHADTSAELDRIERECGRLDTLIGQTLRLARLEEAAVVPLRERVDLAGLIDDIVRDATFEAKTRSCTIDWNPSEEVTVNADPTLLASAIENVVRNAMRYAPTGTTVAVMLHTDRNAGEAVIQVTDEGPGVPPDALATIFEPFVRVGSARERASGGEGLGLAITARAVKSHGGRVLATNRPSGGLQVEIVVPLLAGA